ncbi:MAG: hypothetical protein ACREQA_13090 [Candidatus Binatia bacterium]
MNTQELTYLERLKVSWLFFWRGTLMGAVITLVLGIVVAFIRDLWGLSHESTRGINVLGGYFLSIIVVGPLLIQMMLHNRFRGFGLEITRSG